MCVWLAFQALRWDRESCAGQLWQRLWEARCHCWCYWPEQGISLFTLFSSIYSFIYMYLFVCKCVCSRDNYLQQLLVLCSQIMLDFVVWVRDCIGIVETYFYSMIAYDNCSILVNVILWKEWNEIITNLFVFLWATRLKFSSTNIMIYECLFLLPYFIFRLKKKLLYPYNSLK